jgi:hypothetical protein
MPKPIEKYLCFSKMREKKQECVKKILFFSHFRKMREKKSFFHAFYFFSLIFGKKQNFMFVKNKTLFSTYFFARAKNGRFLTRAPTPLEKRPFLVTRKKNA